MSWDSKWIAKRKSNGHSRRRPDARKLRFEALEGKRLLAGVVDIQTDEGTLTLWGDGSNNNVDIRQEHGVPNSFVISNPGAGDSTLFTLNRDEGDPERPEIDDPTFDTLTIRGITGKIIVRLKAGNDNFRFLQTSAAAQSQVPNDLEIFNYGGSNSNIIDNVYINGEFEVTKVDDTNGFSELKILNSTIVGDTEVNNRGDGDDSRGDTSTVIQNSSLQGGGDDGWGLNLINPYGFNTVDVPAGANDNSQFGPGNFLTDHEIVEINNLGGGSRTSFSGVNDVAGPGTITVYGDLSIENGFNPLGTLDIVTITNINVLGEFEVANKSGNTRTVITGSNLGSLLTGNPGAPVVVRNDAGFDDLTVTSLTAPYGMKVENDHDDSGDSTWGSSTQITLSKIGTHPPILEEIALEILGDDGNDVVNVLTTLVGGTLRAQLFDGTNNFTLTNNTPTQNGSSIERLDYRGGDARDVVTINNTTILSNLTIHLRDGVDFLTILNENYATQWPSALLSLIEIDGGLGVDTFTGVRPPNDLTDFEFFLP